MIRSDKASTFCWDSNDIWTYIVTSTLPSGNPGQKGEPGDKGDTGVGLQGETGIVLCITWLMSLKMFKPCSDVNPHIWLASCARIYLLRMRILAFDFFEVIVDAAKTTVTSVEWRVKNVIILVEF